MEVILLDNIHKLGGRGDTVKVKPGFARNYLFPRDLALPATDANGRVFRERQGRLEKRDAETRKDAEARGARLSAVSCTISVQVGEEDRLYGSVTSMDIARDLANQGHEVDKRQILLSEPIRQLGVFTVEIRLHRDVIAPIKVWVVKQ